MAITITYRPRIAQYTTGSPEVTVYSNWNSAHNKGGVLYGFGIVTEEDRRSTIEINIYEVASNQLLSNSYHRPYKLGDFYIDLSSMLRPYLSNEFDGDFNGERNKKDILASIRFYITYRQIYRDGTTEALINDSEYPFFVKRCARPYGVTSNLEEFVFFPDQQGRFTTKFDQPVKWRGYDRTVSFIWDNYIRANALTAVQEDLNINRAQIDSSTETLDDSTFNGVNMLKVLDPSNPQARYTDLYLVTGDETGLGYVEEGYVDEGYTTIN